jgi:hypothetical protein
MEKATSSVTLSHAPFYFGFLLVFSCDILPCTQSYKYCLSNGGKSDQVDAICFVKPHFSGFSLFILAFYTAYSIPFNLPSKLLTLMRLITV